MVSTICGNASHVDLARRVKLEGFLWLVFMRLYVAKLRWSEREDAVSDLALYIAWSARWTVVEYNTSAAT